MKTEIHILVVDDNPTNLKVVSSFLKEKKYKIALAMSGGDALKILDENKIDLVLLDVMMPEIDGYETCRLIKSKPELADIPVVFLSARNDSEDQIKGFDLGATDFISKPFKKEELFTKVSNHIELKLAKDFIRKYLKNSLPFGSNMAQLLEEFEKQLSVA